MPNKALEATAPAAPRLSAGVRLQRGDVVITRSHIALAIAASVSLLWAAESLAGRDEAVAPGELEAFSVLPPVGLEWQVRVHRGQFEAARSIGANALHTFILQAREYPPAPAPVESVQELALAVQAAAEKESRSPARYELTSQEAVEATRVALECVEYRKRWNDHGAPKTQGVKLIMSVHGLICIHPQERHRLIEVSYSHRSADGLLPAALEREGERFLGSLRPRPKAAPSAASD